MKGIGEENFVNKAKLTSNEVSFIVLQVIISNNNNNNNNNNYNDKH
jgi:hypothetical protein